MLQAQRAAIEFSLHWQSSFGRHNDRRYIEKIDFWRDLLPGSLQQYISSLQPGEKYRESFAPGVLVPPHSDRNIIVFPLEMYADCKNGAAQAPVPGRFYPKSYAWKALQTFPEDFTPFRLIDKNDKELTADINHPLAEFPLTVEASMVEHLKTVTQRGGSANDLAELLTVNGPGMQLPMGTFYRDIYREYPLRRKNEADDAEFYRSPRLVHHLDSTARSHVQKIYARHISPGMKILDLMSSWESHLPDNSETCEISGLGLNSEEMKYNKQLSTHCVHDLNRRAVLPYEDQYFDAVVCTASIEYLSRPREVFAEVARILSRGGVFIVIVSDRWFPGKEIRQWSELHPFERQALILSYFRNEKFLEELETETLRGYPRPADDKYSVDIHYSDPLFVVSGKKFP
jgi:SAM-dependent methyltransferase